MDERQQETAERLYSLIDPWDRPEGGVNAIYNEISLDPVATINYLLDIIDELNEGR